MGCCFFFFKTIFSTFVGQYPQVLNALKVDIILRSKLSENFRLLDKNGKHKMKKLFLMLLVNLSLTGCVSFDVVKSKTVVTGDASKNKVLVR